MNRKISCGRYELVKSQTGYNSAKYLVRFRVVNKPEIIPREKNARWVSLDGVNHSEASVRIAAGDWIRHMNEVTFGTYKLLECQVGEVSRFRVRVTVPKRAEIVAQPRSRTNDAVAEAEQPAEDETAAQIEAQAEQVEEEAQAEGEDDTKGEDKTGNEVVETNEDQAETQADAEAVAEEDNQEEKAASEDNEKAEENEEEAE